MACEVYGRCSKRDTQIPAVLGTVTLYNTSGEMIPFSALSYFGLEPTDAQQLAEANDSGVPFRTLARRILRLPIVT